MTTAFIYQDGPKADLFYGLIIMAFRLPEQIAALDFLRHIPSSCLNSRLFRISDYDNRLQQFTARWLEYF